MKAVTKLLDNTTLVVRPTVGYSPAPIIPGLPISKIQGGKGGLLTHDTRNDDRDHAWDAKPGQTVQRPWHREEKSWNRKDASV